VRAALIAAGRGERLRAGAAGVPKPLVRVAGKPLLDRVLEAAAAAGVDEVACLFNEEDDAVAAHCAGLSLPLRVRIARRSTPSSMESLFALAPLLGDERFLLLTVDAVYAPHLLRDFLAAAGRYPSAAGVLAVTDFVDDEKPLRAAVDDEQRIAALGPAAAASPLVTAGLYVFDPCVFATVAAARAARLGALREWLAALLAAGYELRAAAIGKSVDVDRPEDVAVAEAFIRRGYRDA
jgi:NDP-sugar pyrophosphorylase family protein